MQPELAKLTDLVRGELDWIVMKSMEKDRNNRRCSGTDAGFAMDIRHYLADEGGAGSSPPPAGYRLKKSHARNRGPVGGGGVAGRDAAGGLGDPQPGALAGWLVTEAERTTRSTRQAEQILDERGPPAWSGNEVAWKRRRRATVRRPFWPVANWATPFSSAGNRKAARRDLAFVAKLDRIRQERSAIVNGNFDRFLKGAGLRSGVPRIRRGR